MKDTLDKAFDDLSDVINDPKRVLHVAVVIDESGSMNNLKPFVVKTFNDQLEVLKKESDEKLETRVSVLTFSYPERITFLRWETDVHEVEPMTEKEYNPDGGTALFDSIGMMMDRLREVDDYLSENSAFLLMIITDGEENSSRRYGYKQIKSLLDEMEAGITPDLKKKVLRIADRREAIRTAVMMANDGDVVLVAGKGHETYQEIKGVRNHFDDREELSKAMLTKI